MPAPGRRPAGGVCSSRCSPRCTRRSATTWPGCTRRPSPARRARALPRRRGRPGRRPALAAPTRWSLLGFSLVGIAAALPGPAAAGLAAARRSVWPASRPTGRGTPRSRSSPTPTGSGTRGESGDGPPCPDGRPRGAELPLRRRRHGRRRRPGARLRPLPHRPSSATSGSTWSAAPCGSCCRSPSSRAILLVAAVRPELRRHRRRSATITGGTQPIPGGPVASQEAIKDLGTNGGGFFNANSAHPFENPDAVDQPVRDLPDAGDPVRAAPHLRQDGRPVRQGYAILAAMGIIWLGFASR